MPAPAAWPTAGTPLGVSRKDDELTRQPFRLHLAARGCPKRRVAIGTIAGSPPQGLPPAAWQAPRKGRRRLLQPEPPLPGVRQKGGELARQPFWLVKAAGRVPSLLRRLAALPAALPEVPIALPWAGQGTPG